MPRKSGLVVLLFESIVAILSFSAVLPRIQTLQSFFEVTRNEARKALKQTARLQSTDRLRSQKGSRLQAFVSALNPPGSLKVPPENL